MTDGANTMLYLVGQTRDDSFEVMVLAYPDNVPEREAFKEAMGEFVSHEMNMILITNNFDDIMALDCTLSHEVGIVNMRK